MVEVHVYRHDELTSGDGDPCANVTPGRPVSRVRLILLNGPPGIGKTTLAQRYLVDHPLALNLDIDAIRGAMGQWERHDESKRLARAHAVELARLHLRAGYDVVVPQLLGRLEFVEVVHGVAQEAGAEFHEIVLLATSDETLRRFRSRRAALAEAGVAHPERFVEHDVSTLAAIREELEDVMRSRPHTRIVHTTAGDVEGAYRELCGFLASDQR